MSTVTITFKAKRSEYLDGFSMAPGYKLPAINHSHVSYDNRDSRIQMFLQGLNDPRVTQARLKKAGVPSVAFESDERWAIKPLGNGFMAEVSTSFEV